MKNRLLAGLNAPQAQACIHVEGPLLVLAGAGSGKTKTLTTRLAYLLACARVPPEQTLTLTFTNKAAHEMRERANALLRACGHVCTAHPMLTTFHKFGLFFLKQHAHLLGRQNFKLLSPQEAKTLSKEAILKLKPPYIEERVYLGNIFKHISMLKNHQVALHNCYPDVQKAYKIYQELLLKHNFVDLDDLLALPYALLEDVELATYISQRYTFIMVDEYQDTNPLQFKLLQKLCTTHQNLCVVGDDDQSIYGFRGADINNILDFQDQFPQAKVIKLEQNYRSSQDIVQCANTLIKHNTRRHPKTLFSHNPHTNNQRLVFKHFASPHEENTFLTTTILECAKRGVSYGQMAILYRFNMLCKSIEEGLRGAKIPYRVVGGTGFFERAIIKDLLAYFKVIVDPNDDAHLCRIINTPPRGIGATSLEKIKQLSQEHMLSIYQLYKKNLLKGVLAKRTHEMLGKLYTLLQSLASCPNTAVLNTLLQAVPLEARCSEEDLEYIEGLQSMLEDYFQEPQASLAGFLEQSILEDPSLNNDQALSCMSVHAAKGLEFRVVFIVGFEEDFFPYYKADLEEERRLCYVAITRAKEELYLCSAQERMYFNTLQHGLHPSTFLKEARLLLKGC
ncbi:ATP-dependent helicase [Helicobacter baculiformis]|uniref:DNA 3'-5' helicase n=1 Tax=Helicobacter baculiformis TaxID=427351 RepID=A0ABV7ZK22_9HELI|nr:UvrD-helicase domain-containing protein [Helicobacter baculiformis]